MNALKLSSLNAWAGPSAELIAECAALDQEGAQLLAARDGALHPAIAALQEYMAALKAVMPADYMQQSQHVMWAAAFQQALEASSHEVCAMMQMKLVHSTAVWQ